MHPHFIGCGIVPFECLAETRDPSLYLWLLIRDALIDPGGRQYFETSMKGALVPDGAYGVRLFYAVLISEEPGRKPNRLVVSIGSTSYPRTSDAILRLKATDGSDLQLDRRPKIGTRLEFEGMPIEFSIPSRSRSMC